MRPLAARQPTPPGRPLRTSVDHLIVGHGRKKVAVGWLTVAFVGVSFAMGGAPLVWMMGWPDGLVALAFMSPILALVLGGAWLRIHEGRRLMRLDPGAASLDMYDVRPAARPIWREEDRLKAIFRQWIAELEAQQPGITGEARRRQGGILDWWRARRSRAPR